MALKLWQVYHPNYMMTLVIAETEERAIELTKDKIPLWKEDRLNAVLVCDDLSKEFVSESKDIT
jgi:hypothetical protein